MDWLSAQLSRSLGERETPWREWAADNLAEPRILDCAIDCQGRKFNIVLIQLEPDNGKLPNLIPIAIGDLRAVRPGQWVTAMGIYGALLERRPAAS